MRAMRWSKRRGQGIDEVRAAVSYALAGSADIETLRTTNDNGTAAINLTGSNAGNQIIGNNGDNVINGGGGVDQLFGRGGNDLYFVDNADDSVAENGGQGVDEVRTSVSFTLTAGADVETLATINDNGATAINLTGNGSGNAVRGNNGANVINGGDGNDQLTGRGGQDSFVFNTALNAASNVDVITDFNVADDTIQLDERGVHRARGGTLAANQFVIGAAAQDADDRIIYDNTTGALFVRRRRHRRRAAVQFAHAERRARAHQPRLPGGVTRLASSDGNRSGGEREVAWPFAVSFAARRQDAGSSACLFPGEQRFFSQSATFPRPPDGPARILRGGSNGTEWHERQRPIPRHDLRRRDLRSRRRRRHRRQSRRRYDRRRDDTDIVNY